jgi:hypothetical protein
VGIIKTEKDTLRVIKAIEDRKERRDPISHRAYYIRPEDHWAPISTSFRSRMGKRS